MIGGMQGHSQGDAAWHREQRKHEVNQGDIKLAIDMLEGMTGTDSLDDVSLNHAINVLGDCGNAIAAQAAVIEKFKRAIGDWDRAETPRELQSAEAGLLKALTSVKEQGK